jgi:uncharacterized delta-60 repeat protein
MTGSAGAGPDTSGTLLWQQTLNGTSNAFDEAASVAVDNQGNVVAAGFTENTGTHRDFAVAKFDRDGTLLWQQNINGTIGWTDQATSVAVDNQGSVVAAGYIQNIGTGSDFTVVKFDRDGTLLWQQNLNGRGNGYDRAWSVAVDHNGDVVAAGITQNSDGSGTDFMIAKIDHRGTLLWQQTLGGSDERSYDTASSVAVDNQGNVIVAGSTDSIGQHYITDFTVAKFDPDGVLLWRQDLNGTAGASYDAATSVAVDTSGEVIAAGYTTNRDTGNDFTVAKFARDGGLLWQQNLNGGASDGALSVAVDNKGNVAAAGWMGNIGLRYIDFTVAKFDRDGTLLWEQNLNGTANNSHDRAASLAVDNEGDVVAAGSMRSTGSFNDFAVVKFDRNGALLWQQSLSGTRHYGAAGGVTMDNHGNAVAAGTISNIEGAYAFTVIKFER